jgi:MFS family permease
LPVSNPQFHGWRMVGIAFAMQALSAGATFHAFGVFVKPVGTEFGASRLLTVLGPTSVAVVGAVVSPLLGRALDRGAARAIITGGALLLAAGFGALALVPSALAFTLVFATLIGLAAAMCGTLPASQLVTRWFVLQRGRALGIAAIGSSVGGFVLPPLAAWAIATVGWRGAFAWFGAAVALLFAPLAWRFVVDRPERLGQHPDGRVPAEPASVPGPHPAPTGSVDAADWSNARLLRSPTFWFITLSVGLVFGSTGLFVLHFVPFATDQGIAPAHAAWIQSTYAASAIAGKYLFGRIADRIALRSAFVAAVALQTLAWSGLLLEPSVPLLLAIGVSMGLSSGGRLPVWGAMVAAAFGARSFGRAMGLMGPVMLPLAFAGPPLGGWIHDRTGSYDLALQAGLGVLVVAGLLAWGLRLPRPGHPATE